VKFGKASFTEWSSQWVIRPHYIRPITRNDFGRSQATVTARPPGQSARRIPRIACGGGKPRLYA
jgi:hypothetical protein